MIDLVLPAMMAVVLVVGLLIVIPGTGDHDRQNLGPFDYGFLYIPIIALTISGSYYHLFPVGWGPAGMQISTVILSGGIFVVRACAPEPASLAARAAWRALLVLCIVGAWYAPLVCPVLRE